ncbi:triose-phosphate isomerase [Caballeronia sp. BR00000012568055]|uniref:triose-phosphate isomerase n=1 Tax=Caballeronia sp. BR00000012568055 TaxID=2918761 RepID=UPI0023F74DB2|nr:triose-phosphate isomerase [Caballeronia sp. BR00000012568055]
MSRERAKLVVGNWKMHGRIDVNAGLLTEVAAGASALQNDVYVGVCVPFPYVGQAQALLSGSVVRWGVQDVSAHAHGAYTGEVAADMATDFGSTYAIVGHSERRAYHFEGPELIAEKARRALDAGLTPIVCVGETLEERDEGLTQEVIATQLDAVLTVLTEEQAARIVIAYEPVWAIGTGQSATAAQAQEVHAFLRGKLAAKGASVANVLILYGGSVKPENAQELFGQQDIDGGLIGGASLKSKDFLAICQAAQTVLQKAA